MSAQTAQTTTASSFDAHLDELGLPRLRRAPVTTLQLNIGRRCNLACHHCHVESGPKRTERMDHRGIRRVLELLERNPAIETLDLTGGAPEMHEHFREIVEGARRLGRRVIDRCNLTILFEPGQERTAEFLAANEVEIVASLPCYTAENVEQQRGRGVFGPSIEALQKLGALGYGRVGSALRLDLVYNPLGPTLPPPQVELERDYRRELLQLFGIEFHHLLAITNMPIKRFAHDLAREGRSAEYQALLVNHFNPRTLPGLMCRDLLSVAYDGRIYDCDFNQMLEIEPSGPARTIWDLYDLRDLEGQRIATDSHCFGCSAGAGSSCGGVVV